MRFGLLRAVIMGIGCNRNLSMNSVPHIQE
jgi:hypothetical protein